MRSKRPVLNAWSRSLKRLIPGRASAFTELQFPYGATPLSENWNAAFARAIKRTVVSDGWGCPRVKVVKATHAKIAYGAMPIAAFQRNQLENETDADTLLIVAPAVRRHAVKRALLIKDYAPCRIRAVLAGVHLMAKGVQYALLVARSRRHETEDRTTTRIPKIARDAAIRCRSVERTILAEGQGRVRLRAVRASNSLAKAVQNALGIVRSGARQRKNHPFIVIATRLVVPYSTPFLSMTSPARGFAPSWQLDSAQKA